MKTAEEIKEQYASIGKETCEGYQHEHIIQAMEEYASQFPTKDNRDLIIEKQGGLIAQIIDDYKRRYYTAKKEISRGGNDITLTRLGTKAGNYLTFVSELEKIQSELSQLQSGEGGTSLRDELIEESNEIIRSFNSVIERKGRNTNWEGPDKTVKKILSKQFEYLNSRKSK